MAMLAPSGGLRVSRHRKEACAGSADAHPCVGREWIPVGRRRAGALWSRRHAAFPAAAVARRPEGQLACSRV